MMKLPNMVELPVTEEVVNTMNQEWRKSACKENTLIVGAIKIEERGNAQIIEVEHWHKQAPHIKYWRVISKDEETQQECSEQPALF